MRRDRSVGLIEVTINIRIAGEGVRLRAVGEVVDVFVPTKWTSLSVGLPLMGCDAGASV